MNTGQTSSLLEDPPELDLAAATEILRAQYGIDAELTELRSERDRNFLAVTRNGRQLVLKVSNSGDDPGQIEMESAAMRHVEQVDPGLPIPRIVAAADGGPVVTAEASDGRVHLARVMTVMPGAVADGEVAGPPRRARGSDQSAARVRAARRCDLEQCADRR